VSRRQYADEDFDEAADRRHDEEVQTVIDDAAEATRSAMPPASRPKSFRCRTPPSKARAPAISA
jgi:hypothetical protein